MLVDATCHISCWLYRCSTSMFLCACVFCVCCFVHLSLGHAEHQYMCIHAYLYVYVASLLHTLHDIYSRLNTAVCVCCCVPPPTHPMHFMMYIYTYIYIYIHIYSCMYVCMCVTCLPLSTHPIHFMIYSCSPLSLWLRIPFTIVLSDLLNSIVDILLR